MAAFLFYKAATSDTLELTEDEEYLRALGEEVNPLAFYVLGRNFLTGEYTKQDTDKGIAYLKGAADADVVYAQNYLAEYYREQEEYSKAVRYWRLAAELGDDDAQYQLGRAYLNGEGVQPDANAAAAWFAKVLKNWDNHHALFTLYLADLQRTSEFNGHWVEVGTNDQGDSFYYASNSGVSYQVEGEKFAKIWTYQGYKTKQRREFLKKHEASKTVDFDELLVGLHINCASREVTPNAYKALLDGEQVYTQAYQRHESVWSKPGPGSAYIEIMDKACGSS